MSYKHRCPTLKVQSSRTLEGCKSEWNLENLRKHLKEYVKACEKVSKKKDDHEVSKQNIHSQAKPRLVTVSTKVKPLLQVPLLVNSKQQGDPQKRKSVCTYCTKGHWSDECIEYKRLGERKKNIKGSCFRCLK